MVLIILARRRRRRQWLARAVAAGCNRLAIRYVPDTAVYLANVRDPPSEAVLGILDFDGYGLDRQMETLATLLSLPHESALLNAVVLPEGAERYRFVQTCSPPRGTVLLNNSAEEIGELLASICGGSEGSDAP